MDKTLPILEASVTPVPGQRYRLYERFYEDIQIVNDPYAVSEKDGRVCESRVAEGAMVIRGVFQRADVKNANNRVYSRSLWEKQLSEQSPLRGKIASRAAVGEIEHPSDGVGSLKEAAIVTTKVWMQPDGVVMGEAEVLDTPAGAVVRGLLRSGVRIGISSRGTGTVGADGVVDENTYSCETWDIVGSPSTPGAYPSLVPSRKRVGESTIFEQIGNQIRVSSNLHGKAQRIATIPLGEKNMDIKAKYKNLSESVRLHLAAAKGQLTEAARESLIETLTNASIQIGEMIEAEPTISALGRALQDDIATAMRSLSEAPAKPVEESAKPVKDAKDAKPVEEGAKDEKGDEEDEKDEEDDSEEGPGGDDDEDDEDDKGKNESAENDDGEIRLDESVTEEIIKTVSEMSEDEVRTNLANLIAVTMESAQVLDAQNEQIQEQTALIEALVEENETLTEALNEEEGRTAAAIAMLQEQNAEEDGPNPVDKAIDEAVAADKRLADFRAALVKCESVEEVKSLAANLVRAFGAPATRKGDKVVESLINKNVKPEAGDPPADQPIDESVALAVARTRRALLNG